MRGEGKQRICTSAYPPERFYTKFGIGVYTKSYEANFIWIHVGPNITTTVHESEIGLQHTNTWYMT
jgi:hypothetical protein